MNKENRLQQKITLNKPTWNKRLTDFYNTNKGLIWIAAIVLTLFYLFGSNSVAPFGLSESFDGAFADRAPAMASRQAFGGAMMGAPSKAMMTEMTSGAEYESYPSPIPPPYPGDEAGYVPGADKKIRKTGWVQLEVNKESYETSKSKIELLIGANKGFYISKNEYKTSIGDDLVYRTYSISLKVPVELFDKMISELKEVAEVENINVDASDLTSQYADIKSDLETQKQLKKRVEELLNKAEKIEDIIKLEEKLSEYTQRIDNIQKQLVNIDRQTDYSTITVTLEEKHEVKESFYEFTGLRELVRNVVQSFDSIIVTLSNLIGWIVLALLAFGGYRLYKTRMAK
ncbi:DUF4349 domain-containing protein [Candidatus Woesearchaeota archaeon]|nr:DUF4349 domain-containing protein [Candidatus Woesearchaeota archaeon]